jgi:hypothetical protein
MYRFIFGALVISCSLLAQENGASSEVAGRLSSRWLSLNTASVGLRYATEANAQGQYGFKQGQHQEVLGAAFQFDKDAKYTLQTVIATGNAFNGGWNNTDMGSSKGLYRAYWKQFYFSAIPAAGVEFQYGGIGIEQGVTSDIIGYSGDGYITGQRLIIHRPKSLFFDTIVATYGYVGDLDAPDMNRRFRRLQQGNYRQVLAGKRLGSRAEASVDFTNQWGAKTVRQAIRISTREWHAIDAVRVEFYERTNRHARTGFNFGAEKTLSRQLNVAGGYTRVDRYFGDLNSDAFLNGRRVYLTAGFHITPAVGLFALANYGVHNDYALPNRTHIHFGVTYDIGKAIRGSSKL